MDYTDLGQQDMEPAFFNNVEIIDDKFEGGAPPQMEFTTTRISSEKIAEKVKSWEENHYSSSPSYVSFIYPARTEETSVPSSSPHAAFMAALNMAREYDSVAAQHAIEKMITKLIAGNPELTPDTVVKMVMKEGTSDIDPAILKATREMNLSPDMTTLPPHVVLRDNDGNLPHLRVGTVAVYNCLGAAIHFFSEEQQRIIVSLPTHPFKLFSATETLFVLTKTEPIHDATLTGSAEQHTIPVFSGCVASRGGIHYAPPIMQGKGYIVSREVVEYFPERGDLFAVRYDDRDRAVGLIWYAPKE